MEAPLLGVIESTDPAGEPRGERRGGQRDEPPPRGRARAPPRAPPAPWRPSVPIRPAAEHGTSRALSGHGRRRSAGPARDEAGRRRPHGLVWERVHAHHHHHGHSHGVTRDADQRRLAIALGLIIGFMAVEVIVGLLAGSLALLADAAHMLTDAGRSCSPWSRCGSPRGPPGAP